MKSFIGQPLRLVNTLGLLAESSFGLHISADVVMVAVWAAGVLEKIDLADQPDMTSHTAVGGNVKIA